MQVQPYLFLEGRAEEAIAFYARVLGAECTALMRFNESPDPAMTPPGAAEKVLHAELRIGATTIMLSDGRCGGTPRIEGVSLALSVRDAAEAERIYAMLAEAGQVQMPLGPTFFAASFGMVADRFDVAWMVMAPPPA